MKSLEDIFNKMNKGEMSDSRAFKEYQNAGGDGTFKDFMSNAVENGWVTKVGETVGGFINNKYGNQEGQEGVVSNQNICPDGFYNDGYGNCLENPKQGLSTGAYIGIGLGAVAVIGGLIYMSKNK